MQEETDKVLINGRLYAVTHFTADASGGSFHAKNFDSLTDIPGGHAVLLPGQNLIQVQEVEALHAVSVESKLLFQFSRNTPPNNHHH